MIGDISRAESIYIACGYTDMRKSIDGLSALVAQQFKLDLFSNSLFLFCGRRCDRIKALYWEGDGFVLLYKRLERGGFQWPRKESDVPGFFHRKKDELVRSPDIRSIMITPQQFRWLLEGLQIEQPKAVKPVNSLRLV